MKLNDNKRYYDTCLKEGQEYQDFVQEVFRMGFALMFQNHSSEYYQKKYGENKLGLEIKFNKKYSETGNLWIELQAKTDPAQRKYWDEGINRNDNAWLFVTGTYDKVFIFAKRDLKELADTRKTLENGRRTSIGFLIPDAEAVKVALKVLYVGWVEHEIYSIKDENEVWLYGGKR